MKTAPDIARALSRLALNRGGPRDLGALRAGLAAAAAIDAMLAGRQLPAELAAAREAVAALPADLLAHLDRALADELPLLKRDGGFVRAGYDGELDEMRALRDQSRRVIAGMERDLVEETGIRSLKIRHNNVLGYYIEVTANHQAIMNGSDQAKSRFIHRQTMANAMRFTTTELAELETKIANAADRALADRARRLRAAGRRDRRQRRFDPCRRAGARGARRVGRARRSGALPRTTPARSSMTASPFGSRADAIRSSSRRCGGWRRSVRRQ